MDGPGVIRRNRLPASGKEGGKGAIFQVGEVHGRTTPRLRALAAMMQHVDATGITGNLWGARWSKLVANCMTSALCGASGLALRELHGDADARRVMLRLAGEAIAVGCALGFCIEDVFGLAPGRWLAAAGGDAAAMEQAAGAFRGLLPAIAENSHPGIAQDLAKGRRTEIDYMNGYVAARARECGVAAPTHAGLAALVGDIGRGLREPGAAALRELLGEA
jgi:2-dehydropantoate 2-reductase